MKSHPIIRDFIVIGASAGGVSALKELCGALPPDLPAVVGVVLHRGRWYGGKVSEIYGKAGHIQVQEAMHGERWERGTAYFAPCDHHMLFAITHIQLSRGPKVHFARPAIDLLFGSAANAFHERVAGILLTGSNSDGAQGLVKIRAQGGVTYVQRPEEAAHPQMPLSGLREDDPKIISLDDLPSLIISLATAQRNPWLEPCEPFRVTDSSS